MKTYENHLALSFVSASGIVISSFQLLEVQPDGKKIAVAVVDYGNYVVSRCERSESVSKEEFTNFLEWAHDEQVVLTQKEGWF